MTCSFLNTHRACVVPQNTFQVGSSPGVLEFLPTQVTVLTDYTSTRCQKQIVTRETGIFLHLTSPLSSPDLKVWGGKRRSLFGAWVGTTSRLAAIRKASLIAATSEGHPYNSLIRAIASLSCGSKRTVVGLMVCLSIRIG